jgi:Fe2+ or Zn2+ uptake regulation protein
VTDVEEYAEILRENDLKVTPQRLGILRYLDEHRVHPTAFDIYRALRKESPSISKTTIYNSLVALQKHHIIQVLTISGSELRYDFKKGMHHHFLCQRCGEILDIDIQCPHLERMLKGKHRVEEVHGYFKGICASCLDKERSVKGKKPKTQDDDTSSGRRKGGRR